jgi:hypothetical protein
MDASMAFMMSADEYFCVFLVNRLRASSKLHSSSIPEEISRPALGTTLLFPIVNRTLLW